MLRWRLASATVIIAGLAGLLALDFSFLNFGLPGIWLLPLVWAVGWLATGELLHLITPDPVSQSWTAYAGALLVATAGCSSIVGNAESDATFPVLGALGWPLAASLLLVLTFEVVSYGRAKNAAGRILCTVFAICYVGLPLAFLAQLRGLGDSRLGLAALISPILVVKVSDAGQYFTGRMFGRTKLAPRLSPAKTVEGAVGGVLLACLVSWLYFTYAVPWIAGAGAPAIDWPWSLAFGLAIALAGMIGDLTISLFKRDAGKKDSSRWLPGLGGVLDIVDSVFVAAAPAWFFWQLVVEPK